MSARMFYMVARILNPVAEFDLYDQSVSDPKMGDRIIAKIKNRFSPQFFALSRQAREAAIQLNFVRNKELARLKTLGWSQTPVNDESFKIWHPLYITAAEVYSLLCWEYILAEVGRVPRDVCLRSEWRLVMPMLTSHTEDYPAFLPIDHPSNTFTADLEKSMLATEVDDGWFKELGLENFNPQIDDKPLEVVRDSRLKMIYLMFKRLHLILAEVKTKARGSSGDIGRLLWQIDRLTAQTKILRALISSGIRETMPGIAVGEVEIDIKESWWLVKLKDERQLQGYDDLLPPKG